MDGWMDRLINVSKYQCIKVSMDQWIDGWMDGWMDGMMNGWMDT